jgi:hypothetical protein
MTFASPSPHTFVLSSTYVYEKASNSKSFADQEEKRAGEDAAKTCGVGSGTIRTSTLNP